MIQYFSGDRQNTVLDVVIVAEFRVRWLEKLAIEEIVNSGNRTRRESLVFDPR
ncbi:MULTISPECIES: hypothetical protein [Arthrospira]|uniref:Transposase n=1 Tax=Limnospira platensis NIES-46 TaxID=1236695 RepID=A0A5M3T9B6_LIMPL|nr:MULTISPECIES: hypothetical protein [Arthrospira]MBD2667595.1 hypothetical protein [Arthrospira platensis FACHB-439]MBD2708825.1 hypothetical protein [Arthrospira platensis FACHB-835]MDF2209101.1 hypothetical protein [Arthrospira platensis NCB002]MDT9181215.1 hypothetical protein [Limnospira sp. PMC 289.06]MDT9293591.1 hypothetical protein [Arthrospira platensis PCC 7345]MDT9308891.1 hypothetical protein [Limnospira sp. Paracas R14]QQW29462.1 hypothetical protein AP9108_00540 [Arthrospira 